MANDILYHVDTCGLKLVMHTTRQLERFHRETFVDFSSRQLGLADGMCTDTEGRLWVAMCTGQSVTCWDPKTKKLLLTVRFPKAKRITSCCFGGPNYEWLFVTSGKFLATQDELAENTNSGAVFVIKDLGARGTPSHKFKL